MDSTTPTSRRSDTCRRSKSATRLPQSLDDFHENLPLNLAAPSAIHLPLQTSNHHPLPLQELLLLSPSSLRRPRSRHVERMMMDVAEEAIDYVGPRRKCKSRALSAAAGCGSPKNTRRPRKRFEQQENREDRELGFAEENGKVRKRRTRSTVAAATTRKEKSSSDPLIASPTSLSSDDDWNSLENIKQLISGLIMWKDVAKSSLWFGFGCLFCISSCFARGMSFSLISATSQLGLLFLAVAFFYKSFSQRNEENRTQEFKLKEEDIVRVSRVMLPAANAAIAMTRELFSGEPSMTLKVAPVLVLASEYGHLVTLWRLATLAFFISFTVPKLYSCYSFNIHSKAEYLRSHVWDAWAACTHKRIVAASAATVFWNMSSVKTRIFTAFISVVVLQYYRQLRPIEEEVEAGQQLAIVVAGEGTRKEQMQLQMVMAEGSTH